MPEASFATEADEDILGIADYIARNNPEAARRWLSKMRETCELLAENPEIGQLRPGFGVSGCRSFTLGNYIVFFRPTTEGIQVARIVHGSRDLQDFS